MPNPLMIKSPVLELIFLINTRIEDIIKKLRDSEIGKNKNPYPIAPPEVLIPNSAQVR